MNAETASAAAIAERLRQAPAPLCLASSRHAAEQLQTAGAQDGRLPTIVALPQLLAAAKTLSPAATSAQLLTAARLLSPPAPPAAALAWRIYGELRPHCPHSKDAARLQLARKLAELFLQADEHIALAAAQNPFADYAKRAARAAATDDDDDAAASHEMQVAAAVWDALADAGEEIGAQPHLRRWQADNTLPPFVAVQDEDAGAAQRAFFAASAQHVFALPSQTQKWEQAFAAPDGDSPQLSQLAQHHRAQEGRGDTLADAARLALEAVFDFLQRREPPATLGIVVQDRLLARRLRALAQNFGALYGAPRNAAIRIADSAGWRAESTAIGAAHTAASALYLQPFNGETLQMALRPPFFGGSADATAAARRALNNWRDLMNNAPDAPATYAALANMCDDKQPDLRAMAQGIEAARRTAAGKKTPAAWLTWLDGAAADMLAAWQKDALAQTLRDRLLRQARECDIELNGGEFCLWQKDALAAINVSHAQINSRVQFAATNTRRRFSSLLLLGPAAPPAAARDTGWLGERERAALGLPDAAQQLADERRHFCRLLATHPDCAAVWCAADAAGRPARENPFWRRLAQTLRQEGRLTAIVRRPDSRQTADLSPPRAGAVAGRAAALPASVRLSAADAFMRCPYQFYVGALLRLQDSQEPELDDLSPMMRGELLHKALQLFSEKSKNLNTEAQLQQCMDDALAQTLRGSRPALRAQYLHWRHNCQQLAQWEMSRREAGWHTRATEHVVRAKLPLPGGAVIALNGRLDRWDQNAAGESAIIDYKSGALASVKNLQSGEAPQLALYAYLLHVQDKAAAAQKLLYRPLHRQPDEKENRASPPRVAARARAALRRIAQGAPLPAHGAPAACAACAAAGLCRRDHWT